MNLLRLSIILVLLLKVTPGVQAQYLKRTLSAISEVKIDISTQTAHYKPMFGAGDDSSGIIKAISRFGNLVIDAGGKSNIVKYTDEEQVVFVLEGTGILIYGKEKGLIGGYHQSGGPWWHFSDDGKYANQGGSN